MLLSASASSAASKGRRAFFRSSRGEPGGGVRLSKNCASVREFGDGFPRVLRISEKEAF